MFDIVAKRSPEVEPANREGLIQIVAGAFEMPVSRAACVVENYLATIPRILLARDRGTLVGFHFYDELEVEGVPVFRFSLAAKSSCPNVRGVHRAMVARLLWRATRRINPLRRIALAGVCNNPRTYKNAWSVGGAVFPDVLNLTTPFPHAQLYRQVAGRLGIEGLDVDTGLIENRAAAAGVVMPPSAAANPRDALYQGFLNYVRDDLNRGVFTLVVVRPILAALHHVLRLTRGERTGRLNSVS